MKEKIKKILKWIAIIFAWLVFIDLVIETFIAITTYPSIETLYSWFAGVIAIYFLWKVGQLRFIKKHKTK